MENENNEQYRLGVGMILARSEQRVFAGRRIKNRNRESWQLPQGGIDPNEDIEQAMWRELWEEVGVVESKARIVAISDWLTYDIPPEFRRQLWQGRYIGQRQKWFLLEFIGEDQAISLNNPGVLPEFDAWKWVPFAHIDAMTVHFKRPLYRTLQKIFRNPIQQIDAS